MTIRSTPVFYSNNSSDKQTNYLSELWNKIEKHELRNKKAAIKVDLLFAEYDKVLAPYDKIFGKARCAWLKHLISFLASKELKNDTRKRLMETIEYELNELNECVLFCDIKDIEVIYEEYEAYHDKMFKKEKQQALDSACGEFENIMKEMFGEDINLPHKEIRETLKTGNPFEIELLIDSIRDSYFGHNDESFSEYKQQDDEWDDFEFNYFHGEEEDAFNVKEMFRGTQLNKMYKRIASVIHPDKEIDPLKKEEKHRLMQELAVAKRDNDVMTLVRMFTQYVPDVDFKFDDTTLLQMEHLLEMRIRELNYAHRDLFNNQGFKSIIWKQFSATSKKKIQAKMQEHVVIAENAILLLNKRIEKINSIKRLNKYLKRL